MVFSSMIFLSIALPAVLGVNFILPKRFRNAWLLMFSLLVYAWGEPYYVALLIASIALNYLFAKWIAATATRSAKRAVLTLAVTLNLASLIAHKYLSLFISSANSWFGLGITDPILHLPIGISFYTFQAISYVADVYRNDKRLENNPFNVALYLSLFPQIISGPIVRYGEIRASIGSREASFDKFAAGMERFIVGLSKKVLIANAISETADAAFSAGGASLTAGAAWIGLICYSVQILFDFSGYSDMAIGIAGMLGFRLPENFRYPYAASTMKDFWNRWHITLGKWFRDYVFMPLSVKRPGDKYRIAINLMIVFALTGMWHGISWCFIAWGIWHGVFRAIETFIPDDQNKGANPMAHAYVLIVVVLGWVLFRAENLSAAFAYYRGLAGFGDGSVSLAWMSPRTILALAAGLIGSVRIVPPILEKIRFGESVRWLALVALLLLSVFSLSSSTYNPFIYSRF